MSISFRREASKNNSRVSKEEEMVRNLLLGAFIIICVGVVIHAQELTISEVAWAGTASSTSDEWIEIHNPKDVPVDVTGWLITFGDTAIDLGKAANTVIEAGAYFLLERTDDETVSDITADLIYTGSLRNDTCTISLLDHNGAVIDTANATLESGWAAGSTGKSDVPFATMERIDLAGPDTVDNWASNSGLITCGHDASGEAINGTPRAKNSATILWETVPVVTIDAFWQDEQNVSDTVVISWQSHDPDGKDEMLQVDILISDDGGDTFAVLVSDLGGDSYVWDTTKHKNGGEYIIKVATKDVDGNVGEEASPEFSIAN